MMNNLLRKRFAHIRRKLISQRNSFCTSACWDDLDWNNWWVVSGGTMWGEGDYLKVGHKTEPTVHRVFPRMMGKSKIGMFNGELHWLVEKGGEKFGDEYEWRIRNTTTNF